MGTEKSLLLMRIILPLATENENADLALISSTATAAVIMATALSPPWLPIIIMTSPYTAIATTARRQTPAMGMGTIVGATAIRCNSHLPKKAISACSMHPSHS